MTARHALPHGRARVPFVDAAKALAAFTIMLHHFSRYGPLADAAAQAWPSVTSGLLKYGAWSVQVFLVLGGYLAAEVLLRQGSAPRLAWPRLVIRRWWRLAGPFMVAVLLTLAAHVVTADALPGLLPRQIGFLPLLAHAFLLQDMLGVESLTVGAWYVAIDWQLYALLSLLLVAGSVRFSLALRWVLVFALAITSLLVFNRLSAWDHSGLYFFGSYGLGVACAWMAGLRRDSRVWRAAAGGLLAMVLWALLLDFRPRLLCAALTAAALLALQGRTWPDHWGALALLRAAGKRSYALFLVHFAVCLLGNALFVSLASDPSSGATTAAFWLLMVASSLILANLFFRWVEQPLGQLHLPETFVKAIANRR